MQQFNIYESVKPTVYPSGRSLLRSSYPVTHEDADSSESFGTVNFIHMPRSPGACLTVTGRHYLPLPDTCQGKRKAHLCGQTR